MPSANVAAARLDPDPIETSCRIDYGVSVALPATIYR